MTIPAGFSAAQGGPDSPAAPREVAIIKPSSLGDIVHTLPAVALLKRAWPSTRLRWVVNSEWAPLLAGNPHLDEVIEFPRQQFRGMGGKLRIIPWARALRRKLQADLVLDFQGLLRSALIARLCRGEGGRVVGLSDAREGAGFFYDDAAPVAERPHAVDRYLALVERLGVDLHASEPLEWPLPPGTAPAGFACPSPFVLLHPFSRGEGKSLTAAGVAEFCRALAPIPVVIAGRSPEAMAPAENIHDWLNRTTLGELIWLIRQAAYVVSVDSGPMHIAAALTSRLVSIHTWSEPEKVGPYRPGAWILQNGELFPRRGSQPSAERQHCRDLTALAGFVRRKMDAMD